MSAPRRPPKSAENGTSRPAPAERSTEKGSAPTKGGAARSPAAPKETPTSPPRQEDAGSSNTLRVSGKSRPKNVAGAIAAKLREDINPMVNAIGSESANQAVKAIIMARDYVQDRDHFDLSVKVDQVKETGPDVISISVYKEEPFEKEDTTDDNTLRVGKDTKTGKIAGAISHKVREGVEHLSLTGIGPSAVLKMVKAIALAESYLQDPPSSAKSNQTYSISAVPMKVNLKVGSEERTGVRFDIYTQ